MSDHRLFDDRPHGSNHADISEQTLRQTAHDPIRVTRTRQSALWAAYGDALGFISELTDAAGLRRRTKGRDLTVPIEWTRRIGGRSGVRAQLPAGCYSDDTQLRLAVARAIGPTGFDVEAFAKVELPVWPAYALGGGLSTKAAAANLARATTAWFSNTYDGWLDAGGNGAAMRIQPHVWSTPNLNDPAGYLLDVLRNSVCSHAHPTALVGAIVHALELAHSMATGSPPEPAILRKLLNEAETIPSMLQDDSQLSELWLTGWERQSRQPFADAWRNACLDTSEAINIAERAVTGNGSPTDRYGRVIDELGLLDPSHRGSGMLTVVAAAALTWCDPHPAVSMAIAANTIGSDTDTIGTMAGALLGAAANDELPTPILDGDLIIAEADRLADVAFGRPRRGHRYPDLLTWSAPRTQADALMGTADGLHVAGLGRVQRAIGEPLQAQQGPFKWQWVELAWGQTLLIKRRDELPTVHHSDAAGGNTGKRRPRHKEDSTMAAAPDTRAAGNLEQRAEQPELRRENKRQGVAPSNRRNRPLDIARVVEFVEREQNNNEAIGYAIRRVANEATPEQTASFLAVLLRILRHSTGGQ